MSGPVVFRRWLAVAIVLAGAVAPAVAGCGFPDRRGEADSIGHAIRAMPGVAGADVRYDTSFDGGAHFYLTATLTPAATSEQGAAVSHTFVDKVASANFAHFDVDFELSYRRAGAPEAPAGSTTTHTSTLRTQYSFNDPAVVAPDRSPDAVAEAARWWLDVARSPSVDTVTASLPLHDRYTDVTGPNLHLQVPVSADDTALKALIAAHPQLNSAAWAVSLPWRDPYSPPNSYSVVGLFLDNRLRQTWQSILNCLLPIDHAEASTTLPPKPGQPPTDATLTLMFDNGREGDFDRIARSAAPLLAQLPGPVLFHLTGLERNLAVTIGGCTPAGTPESRPAEPLEAELRHQYEHC